MNWFKIRPGIRGKFLLPIVSSIILGLGISTLAAYITTKSLVLNLVTSEHRNNADLARMLIHNWVEARRLEILSWTTDRIIKMSLRKSPEGQVIRDAIEFQFRQIMAQDPFIHEIGLVNASGETVFSVHDTPSVQNKVKINTHCKGDLPLRFLSTPLGPFLEICATVTYRSSYGKIFTLIDVGKFYRGALLPIVIGEKGFIYIMDINGVPIVTPENFSGKDWFDGSKVLSFEDMNDKLRGSLEYEDENGESRIDSFALYDDLDWIIVVSVGKEELLLPAYRFRNINLWTMFGVALFVGCIIIFFARRYVTRPLLKLKETAVAIAEGQLEREIEIGTNDEIGQLASAFQTMQGAVSEKIRIVKEHNETLDAKVKERTEALERAHQEIVDQAHVAGMAEIATGILHNIGNALVPVKSSLHLIQAVSSDMPVDRLEETNKLLAGKKGQFAEFFNDESKVSGMVDYYELISREIVESRNEISQYAADMDEYLAHVISIIHAQQQYAKRGDYVEKVDPLFIVEQAIKMQNHRIDHYRVDVEILHDRGIPHLRVGRIQAIQVLVNLIQNAIDAMSEVTGDRKLLLELRILDGNLNIMVSDSGPGVEDENFVRLFTHGFTTKEDGHGFGLHSCANVMKKIGGRLTAGKSNLGGACFIACFPLEEQVLEKGA